MTQKDRLQQIKERKRIAAGIAPTPTLSGGQNEAPAEPGTKPPTRAPRKKATGTAAAPTKTAAKSTYNKKSK
jgi:hypothetical protein